VESGLRGDMVLGQQGRRRNEKPSVPKAWRDLRKSSGKL
jgi:hypothetical protein